MVMVLGKDGDLICIFVGIFDMFWVLELGLLF